MKTNTQRAPGIELLPCQKEKLIKKLNENLSGNRHQISKIDSKDPLTKSSKNLKELHRGIFWSFGSISKTFKSNAMNRRTFRRIFRRIFFYWFKQQPLLRSQNQPDFGTLLCTTQVSTGFLSSRALGEGVQQELGRRIWPEPHQK